MATSAPEPERPWLGWVFVKIKSPDEAQWCSDHECDTLFEIWYKLSESITTTHLGVIAGNKMQEGWQEFYFYLPTAKKFENSVAEVMRSFEGYVYDAGTAKDRRWDKYLKDLYPDALMTQQIESRYIINELESEGDDVDVKRTVEHYLFFQTHAQADRAAETLKIQHGYVLKEEVKHEGVYAYGIVMIKDHAVNESVLMQETLKLFEACEREHGIYEGWSTVLV